MSKRSDIQDLQVRVRNLDVGINGDKQWYSSRGLSSRVEEIEKELRRRIPGTGVSGSRLDRLDFNIEYINERLDLMELSKKDRAKYHEFRESLSHADALAALKVCDC